MLTSVWALARDSFQGVLQSGLVLSAIHPDSFLYLQHGALIAPSPRWIVCRIIYEELCKVASATPLRKWCPVRVSQLLSLNARSFCNSEAQLFLTVLPVSHVTLNELLLSDSVYL